MCGPCHWCVCSDRSVEAWGWSCDVRRPLAFVSLLLHFRFIFSSRYVLYVDAHYAWG